MFQQYIDDLKAIRLAVSELRFGDALRKSAEFQTKLAALYDMLTGASPPSFGATEAQFGEFDKELAETEAECGKTRAVPTVGANPLAILAAIKAGIELARMLRDLWRDRNKNTDPAPAG